MIYLIEFIFAVCAGNTYDRMKEERRNRTPEQRANNQRFLLFVSPVLFFLVIGLISNALGAEFKNANGQTIGRSTTNNAGTTYYDASGRNTGRSTTNNTGTTYYDASGRQVGRSTPK